MPNWCANELTITSHPDDKDKLKDLIFNSDTEDVDFELVSPRPKALDGMLSGNIEEVVFNKELKTRTSLLPTVDFIALLEVLNANENEELDSNVINFVRYNINKITDERIFREEERVYYEICEDDILKAELLFINALEKELKSSPHYTPTTPVEDIIEHLLNANQENRHGDPENFVLGSQFTSAAVEACPISIQYAIKKLECFYGTQCLLTYGSRGWRDWNITNWGTKWNADETMPSKDFTHFSFFTAWSQPDNWLRKLAEKVEELGIRDFNAVLRYGEPDMWFGGEITVSTPDSYTEHSFNDDELESFIAI